MRLEDIGFYTLSDERALNSSTGSPLWRCELILTERCNFKCPYCRGTVCKNMSLEDACNVINLWIKDGVKNIRFSGGEPTLYSGLASLVSLCEHNNVEHIALSTNGSASFEMYKELHRLGVNDFSISLDACCSQMGDKMMGIKGAWKIVIDNIRKLSDLTYVTVGMVFNEHNINDCLESVIFADSLGVSDIRVIPSAQYNRALYKLKRLPDEILNKYPILKYRIENIKTGKRVRGLTQHDSNRCGLVLDDMAVMNGLHYPCIIYLRERGEPIGRVSHNMREERLWWMKNHNTHNDSICRRNCLDVCIDFNNKKTYQSQLQHKNEGNDNEQEIQ